MRFDDTWFEIQSRSFLLERHSTATNLCKIGISSSLSSDVILGIVFMKNFYMLFDTDNDQIGIAFHNITRSRYMVGPSYLIKKIPPPPPPPGPKPTP